MKKLPRVMTDDGRTLTIRELRKLLTEDRRHERQYVLSISCTACGARCAKVAYNGGCGRRLCKSCAKDEGATMRLA